MRPGIRLHPLHQSGVGDFELTAIEFGKGRHVDHLSDWQHCVGGRPNANGAAVIFKTQFLAHAIGLDAAVEVERALGQRISGQCSHLANVLNPNALGSRRKNFDVRVAGHPHLNQGRAAVNITAQVSHGAYPDAATDFVGEVRQVR